METQALNPQVMLPFIGLTNTKTTIIIVTTGIYKESELLKVVCYQQVVLEKSN